VQLVITNNGQPPLTTTQTFLVSVGDYVQATLGTNGAQPGGSACLPVSLFTSTGLTNLQFVVNVPPTGLTNWSVSSLSPALCGSTVVSLDATQLLVNLTACAGQSLLATNLEVAELCLDVSSNQPTGLLNIPISLVQAVKATSVPVADTGGQGGALAVVNGRPLLQIQSGTSNSVTLILYSVPNTTNTVLSTPTFGGTNTYTQFWQSVISNWVNPIHVPIGTNTQMYFRAVAP
jgi:hypothetical protein